MNILHEMHSPYLDKNTVIPKTSRGKYYCPYCGITWAVLEMFWKYHLNKPHHKCDICGRAYIRLSTHKRIHI